MKNLVILNIIDIDFKKIIFKFVFEKGEEKIHILLIIANIELSILSFIFICSLFLLMFKMFFHFFIFIFINLIYILKLI